MTAIVPGLNEEASIGRALAEAMETRVVLSRPGRATQQNAGSAVAQADILLLLHADTILPTGYAADVFQPRRVPARPRRHADRGDRASSVSACRSSSGWDAGMVGPVFGVRSFFLALLRDSDFYNYGEGIVSAPWET